MLNISNSYAKIFKLDNKGNYYTCRLSTYKKDKQTGEYQNSWWNCKIVGKAKDLVNGVADKTKIKINSAVVENRDYTTKDGQKRSWLEVVIFDLELAEQVGEGVPDFRDVDELPF